MKKIGLWIAMLLLTSCSHAEITKLDNKFKGSSQDWKAEYHVKGTETWDKVDGRLSYDNNLTKNFSLEYIGDPSVKVSKLKVEYDGSSLGYTYGKPEFVKNIHIKDNGKTNSRVYADDSVMVTVTMDHSIETFKLINVKQK
ncbi:hypothetical protein [Paenibacillus gansuensis]|uniref:Lipocalin-like domain-containing protein n=1 Tax=Paenibacillus gansuensis TaxID=306542 RepID=A0ABW5P9Q6_9BACL